MLLLVDTSAWIEFLRDTGSAACLRVDDAIRREEVLTTDPVIFELMAGARAEHEDRLRRLLSEQDYEPFAPRTDWLDAAAIYRVCRRRGVTIRSHLDCLIAAVAIRRNVPVLHVDRDFGVIAECVPLSVAE
jgi:predicted nucleic acid-binding protein